MREHNKVSELQKFRTMLSSSRVHVSQENSGQSVKKVRKPVPGGRHRHRDVLQSKTLQVKSEAPRRRGQMLKEITNVPKQDHVQEKPCKHEYKPKRDEALEEEYFIPHNQPECNPNNTDSIFTSEFVPSSAFRNLVTAINNTPLLTRYSKPEARQMPSLTIQLEERPIDDIFEDYPDPGLGNDAQLYLPELQDIPDTLD